MLEIWVCSVLYVKKLPTPPPLFHNKEMSEWFSDLPRSPCSSLSQRWLKSLAVWCPSCMTCSLELVIVSPISWAWTDPGICYYHHLPFFLSQGSTQGEHSRPLAPPFSTPPSILACPLEHPHPLEILVWMSASGPPGRRGCLSLAPTPQPSFSLPDFHHDQHTW